MSRLTTRGLGGQVGSIVQVVNEFAGEEHRGGFVPSFWISSGLSPIAAETFRNTGKS